MATSLCSFPSLNEKVRVCSLRDKPDVRNDGGKKPGVGVRRLKRKKGRDGEGRERVGER